MRLLRCSTAVFLCLLGAVQSHRPLVRRLQDDLDGETDAPTSSPAMFAGLDKTPEPTLGQIGDSETDSPTVGTEDTNDPEKETEDTPAPSPKENEETTAAATAAPTAALTAAPTKVKETPETSSPTVAATEFPTIPLDNKWPTGDKPGGNEDPSPWNNPDYQPPEKTKEPYKPPDDDPLDEDEDDEIKDKWEDPLEKAEKEAEKRAEEILRDKNVRIVSGVLAGVAFLLMLCIAQQTIENPDGCCAKICRCMVACARIICYPCRVICCCCCRSSRAKDRRTHDLMMNEEDNYGYSHDLELT